jgi:hypothetical protein
VRPVTERLVGRLRALGRRRVDLETVLRLFSEVDAAHAFAPDRRQRLRDALDEAQSAGALIAGKPDPADFERPPLPRSLRIVGPPPAAPVRSPAAGDFWRPELAWAAALRLTPEEQGFLRAVDAFLRDRDRDEPVVPVRERSLELLGDEKRLDGLIGGRLFAPGRLSVELLRCERVHPPFVWRPTGTAPVLLVVENHHTFHSLGQVLTEDDGVGVLGYGAGNHFVASVTSAADLPGPIEAIRYFGDLDEAGLRIPAKASRSAAGAGLPPVRPAGALYEALLQFGRVGAAEVVPPARAIEATAWLPEPLRPDASVLLTCGRRMAQEGLGLKYLRRLKATGGLRCL